MIEINDWLELYVGKKLMKKVKEKCYLPYAYQNFLDDLMKEVSIMGKILQPRDFITYVRYQVIKFIDE